MLKEEQILGRKLPMTRYETDDEKLRLTTCVANITK